MNEQSLTPQRIVYFIMLLFCLSAFITTCAQDACNKNYLSVKDTLGCKIVQMSSNKFAYYYQLSQVADTLPTYINSVREERRLAIKNSELLSHRVMVESRKTIEAHKSLYECIDESVSCQVSNKKLKEKVKKRNKILFFQNLGIAGIIALIILL